MSKFGDRPNFHLASKQGWVNDPNGPLFYKGKFHLFYQHVRQGASWDWGLVWGHAISDDLVHWRHLPPALTPTPGGKDQDGCFSGCATLDEDGTPTLIYTGVTRIPDLSEPPDYTPSALNVTLLCNEVQLAARAQDNDDEELRHWEKLPQDLMPPPGLRFNCFRDPFLFQRPREHLGLKCNGDTDADEFQDEWLAVLGGGLPDGPHPVMPAKGAAFLYRSRDLLSGWRYAGLLCSARDEDDGQLWECPVLVHLPLHQVRIGQANGDYADRDSVSPLQNSGTYLFCASTGFSPSVYWLGSYAGGRFDMATARGPLPLDLGSDIVYAPNVLRTEEGRVVLWAWLAETPNPRDFLHDDYAGCISLPRELSLDAAGRLHQQPLREISHLRTGREWHTAGVALRSGCALELPEVCSAFAEVELTLQAGSSRAVAVLIQPWERGQGGGAAVVYRRENHMLEVLLGVDSLEELERELDVQDSESLGLVSPAPDARLSTPIGGRTSVDSLAGGQASPHARMRSGSVVWGAGLPARTPSGFDVLGTPPSGGIEYVQTGTPEGSPAQAGRFTPGWLSPCIRRTPVPGGASTPTRRISVDGSDLLQPRRQPTPTWQPGWSGSAAPSPQRRVSFGAADCFPWRSARAASAALAGAAGAAAGGNPEPMAESVVPAQPRRSLTVVLPSSPQLPPQLPPPLHRPLLSAEVLLDALHGFQSSGSEPASPVPLGGPISPAHWNIPSPGRWPSAMGQTPTRRTPLPVLYPPPQESHSPEPLPSPLGVPPVVIGGCLQLDDKDLGGDGGVPGGGRLSLRLFLDYSVLEVFTSSGEVLTTRVYRGAAPRPPRAGGVLFAALGGEGAVLEHVAAYEMGAIWLDEEQEEGEQGTAGAAATEFEAGMGQKAGEEWRAWERDALKMESGDPGVGGKMAPQATQALSGRSEGSQALESQSDILDIWGMDADGDSDVDTPDAAEGMLAGYPSDV